MDTKRHTSTSRRIRLVTNSRSVNRHKSSHHSARPLCCRGGFLNSVRSLGGCRSARPTKARGSRGVADIGNHAAEQMRPGQPRRGLGTRGHSAGARVGRILPTMPAKPKGPRRELATKNPLDPSRGRRAELWRVRAVDGGRPVSGLMIRGRRPGSQVISLTERRQRRLAAWVAALY